MHILSDKVLNFLDIETTGTSYNFDKIIEIYISKVKEGVEISKFHTLVNPGFKPNQFITKLTGIQYVDLKSSPSFEDVAEDLYEFISDGLLIAHNARFDYSFIKKNLKDYGLDINLDYCCTVKLSRYLYPRHKNHRLDNLIERTGFEGGDRHRASYDTEAVKHFFYKSIQDFGEDEFYTHFNKSIKQAAIPQAMLDFNAKEYPEAPGVYIFYDKENTPIYIGMSKNLRRRILEHFYQDLTNSKDMNITQNIKKIEFIQTAGILGALLRESMLIKKYQPLYNRLLRRNRNLIKLERFVDADGYFNIKQNNDNHFDLNNLSNIVGVFRSKDDLKNQLEILVKENGLCPKLLGLEKKGGACFAYQLERCKGACVHKIDSEEYNKIFNEAFKETTISEWPYESSFTYAEEGEGLKEEFTFDKWCLVGSSCLDLQAEEINNNSFDLDTYKILKRFLTN